MLRPGSFIVLGWLIGAVGCAAHSPLVLTVWNETDTPVVRVEHKGCDEPADAFVEFERSTIPPGESRRFVLPYSCVDLAAYDERRAVGELHDLRPRYSFPWHVKR